MKPASETTETLWVYHDQQKVGELTARPLQEGGYLLVFMYDPSWKGFPLSPHLPLGEISKGAPVWNFFLNLLPEGHVLEDVAYRMNLRIHDVFGFLRHFGRDCAGALSLLLPEEEPSAGDTCTPIEVERLRRYLPDGPRDPKREYGEPGLLFMYGGKPRMSLAGAQNKLGVRLTPEGTLFLPEGTAPSTHILKSSCHNDFPFCVLNEYLVMQLAATIGLPVPQVTMLRLPEPVYLVERFDREKQNGQWKRLHQIDMCQYFDAPNTMKYEEGAYQYAPKGLTLKDCFAFARSMRNPDEAIKNVLKWTCFNFLTGNTDAHAKNIAALVDESGLRPAPFYDLLCVRAYGDAYTNMAFCIGGEDHLSLIDRECWLDMAEECGVSSSDVFAELKAQVQRLPHAFTELVAQEELSSEEQNFVEEMLQVIEAQCAKIESMVAVDEGDGSRP